MEDPWAVGIWLAIDLIGIAAVLFVRAVNVRRVDALVSLGASGLVSAYLYDLPFNRRR